MKNISIVLGSLSLTSALVLFASCDTHTKEAAATTTSVSVPATGAGANKIAYVNIDTLEAKYELLKSKREDFKARQIQMEGELQSSYQKMQADAIEVQKKAQANTLTQSEYEAAQKRLGQMQQSLETRKQSLTEQLVKEQDDFNKDLKTRLDAFLEEYNKTKQYDYIMSYSAVGSSILYVNKQLDITKDVVDGMNATSKNGDEKKNK
jgi:outer membrane protein